MFLQLIMGMQKMKETGQPTPALISKPTAIVVCFVVLLAFLISFFYPFMSWLMWNSSAFAATVGAYYVSTNDASEHISDKSTAVTNQ
jgi:hypothetical protein